ncbi:uncharacterized protein CBL_11770 [Carabus blaptoides fortunei]
MQGFQILFVISLCYVSTVSASSIFDLLTWNLEPEDTSSTKRDGSTTNPQSCACNGPSCMCCVDFNVTFIDLGGPGCVHMKYISEEEGIDMNVSYGNSVLHAERVKGPNPEPSCIPFLANLAHICARYSDLYPTDDGLRGCLSLEPKLLNEIQTSFFIGCFTMGPDGMKLDTSTNDTAEESETGNFFGIDLRPSRPEADDAEEDETKREGEQTEPNASTESARHFPTDVRPNTKK